MTADVLMLGIGALLIAVATIGGGVEAREIKFGKMSFGSRFATGILGAIFLVIGLTIWVVEQPEFQSPQEQTNDQR